ncbi:ParB/RepB/Spo0J family partition protein [Arcanobacterium canis]
MAEKRRGLGVGLGSLIPNNQKEKKTRPIDVFFAGATPQPNNDQTAESARKKDSVTAADKVSPKVTASTEISQDVAKKLANETTSGKKKAAENRAPEKDANSEIQQIKTTSLPQTIDPKAGTQSTTGTQSTSETDQSDDALLPIPGTTYGELDLQSIMPNRAQPRTIFDEDDLQELADSIKEVGVLQPIVVRPLTETALEYPEVRYELIMGERRWRAAQRAGLSEIPAIVRHTQDTDLLRDALLENLHRAQLNPLEEAAAYQQLLEDFGCTQEELSRKIARSRPQISNTLRLMKLPPLVQRRVAAGVLSAGHARALLGLTDPAAMERLAQRIVAEGLSVRAVEEIVAMGEEGAAAARRRPRVSQYPDELGALATRLADRLNTRVKVNMGQRKGKIAIDFGSLDDLNRILSELGDGGIEFPIQHSQEG